MDHDFKTSMKFKTAYRKKQSSFLWWNLKKNSLDLRGCHFKRRYTWDSKSCRRQRETTPLSFPQISCQFEDNKEMAKHGTHEWIRVQLSNQIYGENRLVMQWPYGNTRTLNWCGWWCGMQEYGPVLTTEEEIESINILSEYRWNRSIFVHVHELICIIVHSL